MTSVNKGSKIKDADYEGQLIFWILEDPQVSNYALSRMLKDKLNIDVSSPTISAWRRNYFPTDESFIEAIKQQFVQKKENIEKFEKSLADKVSSVVDKYIIYSATIEKRIGHLEKIQSGKFDKQVKDEANKTPRLDYDLEKLILNYWSLLDKLRKASHKFTGGAEYVQRLQSLITEVASVAIKVFFPHVVEDEKDEVRINFRKAIDAIEAKLYDSIPEEVMK